MRNCLGSIHPPSHQIRCTKIAPLNSPSITAYIVILLLRPKLRNRIVYRKMRSSSSRRRCNQSRLPLDRQHHIRQTASGTAPLPPPPPRIESLLSTKAAVIAEEASQFSLKIKGAREKRKILDDYEARYGDQYPHSITTKKKGKTEKHVSDYELLKHRMLPSSDKYYRVEDLSKYHVISTVLKEYQSSFTTEDFQAISAVNSDFSKMVPRIMRWINVDLTPLKKPRLNYYEQQQSIDPHRVEMASAAMVHLGMDPGKLVCFLGGEYTGERRDVRRILCSIHGHVSREDYNHIKWILLRGCPAKLKFTESNHSKVTMLRRGNQKSFNDKPGYCAEDPEQGG